MIKHLKNENIHFCGMSATEILFFIALIITETSPAVIDREKSLPMEVYNTDEEASQRVLNLVEQEKYQLQKEETKDKGIKSSSSPKLCILKHFISPSAMTAEIKTVKETKKEIQPEKSETFDKEENEKVNQEAEKHLEKSYMITDKSCDTKESLMKSLQESTLLLKNKIDELDRITVNAEKPKNVEEYDNRSKFIDSLTAATSLHEVKSQPFTFLPSSSNEATISNGYLLEGKMEPSNIVSKLGEQETNHQSIDESREEVADILNQDIKNSNNKRKLENHTNVTDLLQISEDKNQQGNCLGIQGSDLELIPSLIQNHEMYITDTIPTVSTDTINNKVKNIINDLETFKSQSCSETSKSGNDINLILLNLKNVTDNSQLTQKDLDHDNKPNIIRKLREIAEDTGANLDNELAEESLINNLIKCTGDMATSAEENTDKQNTEKSDEIKNNIQKMCLLDQTKIDSNQEENSLNKFETEEESILNDNMERDEVAKSLFTDTIDKMITENNSDFNENYNDERNIENPNKSVSDITKDLLRRDSDNVLLTCNIESNNPDTEPNNVLTIKENDKANKDTCVFQNQQKIDDSNNDIQQEPEVIVEDSEKNLIQVNPLQNDLIETTTVIPENNLIKTINLVTLDLKNNSGSEKENTNNANGLEINFDTGILPMNEQVRQVREISEKYLPSNYKDDALSEFIPVMLDSSQEQLSLKKEQYPAEALTKLEYSLRVPREINRQIDNENGVDKTLNNHNFEKIQNDISNNEFNRHTTETMENSNETSEMSNQSEKQGTSVENENIKNKLIRLIDVINKMIKENKNKYIENTIQDNYLNSIAQISENRITELSPKASSLFEKNHEQTLGNIMVNQMGTEPENEQKLFELLTIVNNIIKNRNEPEYDEILSPQMDFSNGNEIVLNEIPVEPHHSFLRKREVCTDI